MTSAPHELLTDRLKALRRPLPAEIVAKVLRAADTELVPTSLTGRLYGLRSPLPSGLINRSRAAAVNTRSGQHPRGPWRWRSALVALAILIGLNGAASYFVPVYAGALAHLPGVGDFLRWSDLSPGDLATIDVATEHDGVRLHVSAGYADANHTVLVLDFRGPSAGGRGVGGFDAMSLSDQFGHTYAAEAGGFGIKSQPAPSAGQDVPGYATFQPITGLAASLGARLTLSAEQFDMSTLTGQPTSIKGSWQVSFVLERRPPVYVDWQGASIRGATYTFSHVTVTDGSLVEIGWTARGPAVAAANAAYEAAASGATDPRQFWVPFLPILVDSSSRPVPESVGVGGDAGGGSLDHMSGTSDYQLKPGRYRFVLLSPTGGYLFARDLSIP
ncbi:MAG: DUF4179 domain-containing protein [Candidatus Dormibacteraeota bacterium]|nr:DUF4179 domain-containing protein [Candidatus Dormibacteraeota bacterium]